MATPSMGTDIEHCTMVLAKCIVRIAEGEFSNFVICCRVPVTSASVFKQQQIVIEVPSGDCISTARQVVDAMIGRQINGCIVYNCVSSAY